MLVLLVLVLVSFLSACVSSEVALVPTYEGVTIARRGVSLLPSETAVAADETLEVTTPQPEAVTSEPTSLPTETPTVPRPQPSSTPASTDTAAPTKVPDTPSPTVTPEPEVCQGGVNRSLESEIINLINLERAKESLPKLTEQSQLTQTARLHAEDMACNDFFSHESPANGGVVARVTAQGYAFSAIGEIIGAGYADSQSVIDGWMASADHKSNILNPDFTQIGVGYAAWDDSSYGYYWVVVFGTPIQ